jgi:Arc/MetJ family transcription regulator
LAGRSESIHFEKQEPGLPGKIDNHRGQRHDPAITVFVLNEDLLEETVRVAGTKTYSRAVEIALRDFVRRAKARRILELTGLGLWEGNLEQMREDRPRKRKP